MCEKKYKFKSYKDNYCEKKISNDTIYYKNGTEIELEEASDKKNNKKRKVKYLNELKKSINDFTGKYSNSFDNVILLLGAGASLLDKKTSNGTKSGVTMNALKDSVYDELKNDKELYSVQEIVKRMNLDEDKCLDENHEKLSDSFGLEDFISNMKNYLPFCLKDTIFKSSLEKIYNIIIDKTNYDFKDEKFNHAKLINIVNNDLVKKEKKLNIVTTNYDTLIEEAADSLNYTVFDGFSFSARPTFDEDMFDWNLSKKVPGIQTNEEVYKSNVINLLKIHGSLTWKQENGKIVRTNKAEKSDDNGPVMIFPSSDKYKQTYQEPYFSLFNKFRELMRRPNTLLITLGFSFSDNHIAEMIESNIKNNPEFALLATKHSFDDDNENWNKITKLMDSGYRVAILKSDLSGDLCDLLGGKSNDN